MRVVGGWFSYPNKALLEQKKRCYGFIVRPDFYLAERREDTILGTLLKLFKPPVPNSEKTHARATNALTTLP